MMKGNDGREDSELSAASLRPRSRQQKKIAPMVKKKSSPSNSPPPTGDRLQKVLALAGLGSRRQCEELITTGRVEVDRKVISELGARVDAETQEVRVDGQVVKLPRKKYFLLHKPVDVISTSRDPWARTRVIDLVEDSSRLFTVGRLDKASSGLILVTNDGDLAQKLTHPRYGIEKVYRATVVGKPSPEAMRQLRQGLYLAEGKTHVERVTLLKPHANKSLLEIVLKEGRNREIRRILARVGHKVVQLKRIAIGPLRLGELPLGAFRELTRSEVQALQRSAQPSAAESRATPSQAPKEGKKIHSTPRAAKPTLGRTKRDLRRPATQTRPGSSKRPASSGAPLHARRSATVIGGEEAWPADADARYIADLSDSDQEETGRRTDEARPRKRFGDKRSGDQRSGGKRAVDRRSGEARSDRSQDARGGRRKPQGRPRTTGGDSGPRESTGGAYGSASRRPSRPVKKKGRRPIIQRKKRSS